MTPKEVLALTQANDVKMVDFKFCYIHGSWQHFTIPVGELSEDTFEDGLGFDASSIRGWAGIEASDMLVIPDSQTAFIDPFPEITTLSLTCDIEDSNHSRNLQPLPTGHCQTRTNLLTINRHR